MNETARAALAWLTSIPDELLYLAVGLAAAIENIVPPFPGDVVVIVGGVVAGARGVDPAVLFVITWFANSSSALFVYALGRRYGQGFFDGRIGRYLLAPEQVTTLSVAYQRYGTPIIFFSRFLPVFRPIVPVFAGVARLGFWRTALPILLASGLWYGFLVYLGTLAGANWRSVMGILDRIGFWLWVAAGIAIAGITVWWFRSRRTASGDER